PLPDALPISLPERPAALFRSRGRRPRRGHRSALALGSAPERGGSPQGRPDHRRRRALRLLEAPPDDRPDVARALGGELLRGTEQRFVLASPLRRHVRAEV